MSLFKAQFKAGMIVIHNGQRVQIIRREKFSCYVVPEGQKIRGYYVPYDDLTLPKKEAAP